MKKAASSLFALTALASLLASSCGSSVERVAVRRSDAGAAGEAGAGGEPAEAGAGAPSSGGNAGNPGKGDAGANPAVGGQPGGGANAGGAGGALPNEAGAGGQPTPDGGAAGAGPVVLPEGGIVDVPYTCDSPFDGIVFDGYFYLDDFEDATLNTPGVTAPNTISSFTGFGAGVVDSVDCDDGATDGTCLDCDALFGQGSIELTFDAQVLGELPTHVGLVWTDGGGGASVTITGYDDQDAVVYAETVDGLGDSSVAGTVEEDRFFGIVHFAGIKRVVIVNSTGGLEIDHLQYGR